MTGWTSLKERQTTKKDKKTYADTGAGIEPQDLLVLKKNEEVLGVN